MSYKLNLFIAVTLLLSFGSCQKTLNVKCSTCTVTECSSGWCFKLQGDDFAETVCVAGGKTCNLALDTDITLKNCSYAYDSIGCSTGVCFSAVDQPIALLGGTCDTPSTRNISCGNCQNTVCASDICKAESIDDGTPVTSCVDGCPPTDADFDVLIDECPNGVDAVGVQNTCCTTFQGTAGDVCTSQSNTLISSRLRTWVTGQLFEVSIGKMITLAVVTVMAFVF